MPTRLHHLLSAQTRFDLWYHLRQRGDWRGKAQRVEGDMYIKLNFAMRPEEGKATTFARAHTNIPIPFVIDNVTVTVNGRRETALVLERLPGRSPEITSEIRKKIADQLSSLLAQLRAIPPPEDGAVCGFVGGPLHCEQVTELVWDTIKKAHSQSHRICFSHGDLGAHNVLIDDEFNVTAIIDWEMASWMPEYWEFTKSTFQPIYRGKKSMWFQIMSNVFPQYALERRAELFVWRYREHYS
ncbi:kinase-like protein [Pholiota conissans]|uniref:Kinase-like protein n=1 Tax=Pholiota conissans TaxID=109636 RepID=A0A9P6CU78_9AGAR|nr:kinase-like protein [Pholiota conissans]